MTNPPDNSTLINICIIPNNTINEECIKISQSLESKSTIFVLDGKTKFAHMTIYMARFSNDDINKVIEAGLGKIVTKLLLKNSFVTVKKPT